MQYEIKVKVLYSC